MKCPHCLVSFYEEQTEDGQSIGEDTDGRWNLITYLCPNCGRYIIQLVRFEQRPIGPSTNETQWTPVALEQVHPLGSTRPPCPQEVPSHIAEYYNEACLVFPYSAKAAAALGRTCLQVILRETAAVKTGSLADEIQQVLDSGTLPSHLASSIDAIRNLGNFAAHPIKSQQTGTIMPVEPGEAEWTLDVLEGLFDFYFVQPAIMTKKKDALNAKLREAGKPEMK